MTNFEMLPPATNDAMDKLRAAMAGVLENWVPALDERYPFNDSFDEMLDQVVEWQRHAAAGKEVVYSALREAAEKKLTVFEHEGIAISDVFVDETSRFQVDPLKYYGKNKIRQATFVLKAGGLL